MNLPLYSPPSTQPCARYEGGENDQRLISVWIYVAGLIGGSADAEDLGKKVARLYDYKGSLIVATRDSLSIDVEAFFRCAWVTIGKETKENVEFLPVRSDRWKSLWGSRRFESDWQP